MGASRVLEADRERDSREDEEGEAGGAGRAEEPGRERVLEQLAEGAGDRG